MGKGLSMETIKPDDDEVQPDEAAIEDLEPDFGEHDEAAQEAEWIEDAQEGGVSES
jgi:hypothetical protein